MKEIDSFLHVMTMLRTKCPWDAAQTHDSLKRYLLEETYETLDAIDSNDMAELKSELGDLLLQIVFHSEIASEQNQFTFSDVVNTISEKMIERHPHVFDNDKGISAEDVIDNWEKHKRKNENRSSIFSGLPNHLPALLKAQKLQEKASKVGFDWDKKEDVLDKIKEELLELQHEVAHGSPQKISDEFGDILFTLTNLSRFLDINAEESLHKANKKFQKRFRFIEDHYKNDADKIAAASLDELDKLWEASKDFD